MGARVAQLVPRKNSSFLKICGRGSRKFFKLRYRADGITITTADLNEVGVLEDRYARALKNLKNNVQSVRCEAYLIHQQPDDTRTTPASLPVEINIYGSCRDLEGVGLLLSEADMFLQEPDYLSQPAIYQNPHVYSSHNDSATPRFRMQQSTDELDVRAELDAIINEPHTVRLQELSFQDSRLRSHLQRLDLEAQINSTRLLIAFAVIRQVL